MMEVVARLQVLAGSIGDKPGNRVQCLVSIAIATIVRTYRRKLAASCASGCHLACAPSASQLVPVAALYLAQAHLLVPIQ